MDLFDRAGDLKGMLVGFATSPRFDRQLSAAMARNFPDGMITDQALFTMVLDHFVLQHRLPSGTTMVEEFVAAHPELPDAEKDMLLGWRDVVEGTFEVTAKERDAVLLFNFLDELTYRTRSNMGPKAFRPLKKGTILISRLVRVGDDWMVSGHMSAFPAKARDTMLAAAAKEALHRPEAVFRNPAKLAEARRHLATQHAAFVDLFGDDLVVVPGHEVPGKVEAFHRHLARRVRPEDESPEIARLDLPDEVLEADSVAIYFVEGEGLSFYPNYHVIEELFGNPALIHRPLHRDSLSRFLRDPEVPPEPLRRLAARDPAKTDRVFARLLKRKRGFSWEAEGEELLRRNKPGYFDGPPLPRTVALSKSQSDALQRAR